MMPSRGHHEDHEVGHLGAACPHRGERGMTRRIDEGDRVGVRAHLIRADVLGDAACLAGHHVRLADRVEQRGLAVVDVSHHGDDDRPLHERLGLRGGGRLEEALLLEADVLNLEAELLGHAAGGLDVDRLVDRDHGAERHQLALDLRRLRAELARELGHADRALDAHHAARRLRGARGRGAARRQRIAPLPPRRCIGARVDHRLAEAGPARDLARELLLLAEVHDLLELLAALALRGGLVARGRARARCRRLAGRLGRGRRRGGRGPDGRHGLRLGLGRDLGLGRRDGDRGLGPALGRRGGDGLGRGRRERGGGRLGLRDALAPPDHRAALARDARLGHDVAALHAELLAQERDLLLVERGHRVAQLDSERTSLLDELVALDAELFRDLVRPDRHPSPFRTRGRIRPAARGPLDPEAAAASS